jgi:hypothetical protein
MPAFQPCSLIADPDNEGSAGDEGTTSMSADDLLQRVRARPFVPFRLVLTEGTPYEVRHPDHIMVTRTIASIGRPSKDEQSLFESVVWVSLLHIVRLEPLEAKAPAGGNGAAGA